MLALWLSWLLAGPAWGQATQPMPSVLTHLVQPTPGTRSLGDVLAELSRQGELPFSYSSSLIPVNRQCYLKPGPARPVGTVLREVLATTHLSYGLLEGQLVLWPEHVAAPAGVVMVNGRASLPAEPTHLAAPSKAAVGRGEAEATAKSSHTQDDPLASRPVLSNSVIGLTTKPLKQTRTTVTSRKTAVTGSQASATLPGYVMPSRPHLSHRRTQYDIPANSTKSLTNKPFDKTGSPAAAVSPGSRQHRTYPKGYRQQTTREVVIRKHQSPARSVPRPPYQSAPTRETLALLAPLAIIPKSALAADGIALPLLARADSGRASGQNSSLDNKPAPDSAAEKSNTLAGLLRRSYLHGEAWGGESLPLNAAVKFGLPRIYLVLGVAAGPFDHQSGGAWGVGVGTVGQPRGRFTPSLDLLHWFVGGRQDDGPRGQQLTQLRPTLAWQIKRGSRWQLIGGPTLNLAAAHRDGQRTRWDLGQGQWLWLASEDGLNLLRLWPGFQLGVRF